MKTSYMLLGLVVLITLMGMTATNVLLKQEYDKLDWSNPLQGFEERVLPTARHWVIDGRQFQEIIIEPGQQSKAFIKPRLNQFFSIRQRGDTVYVSSVDKKQTSAVYHHWEDEESIELVLRLPSLESVWMKDGLLTVRKFTLDSLNVSLKNCRLRTSELTVTNRYAIDIQQWSNAILGADQYGSLQAVVRDSSALQLGNTQINKLAITPSLKAEVELTGRALYWLGKRD